MLSARKFGGVSFHKNGSGSDLISADTISKTDKNLCRGIFSAEAVKIIYCPRSLRHSAPSYIQMSFQISSVLLPMKPYCSDQGIALACIHWNFHLFIHP